MRRVYLGGPITGYSYDEINTWRTDTDLIEDLREIGWDYMSPMEGLDHLAATYRPIGAWAEDTDDKPNGAFQAVTADLSMIANADAMLMNLAGAKHASIGTMAEMGFAYAIGVPIIAVMDEDDQVHDHPFVKWMARTIVPTLEDAVGVLAQYSQAASSRAHA